MNVLFGIIGAIFGVLVELLTPWSQIIMKYVNDCLENESLHNYTGLPTLILAVGIFLAYLLLPLGFGSTGFAIGSK
jgi:hypothetical protein